MYPPGFGRSWHLASSRGIYSWGDGVEPHKTAVLNTNRLFMLLMDVDRRPDFGRDRPLPWHRPGSIPFPPLSLLGRGPTVFSFLPDAYCPALAFPLSLAR